ncbi:MAG: hypothetical protein OXG78_01325 [Chloroflexi bacterium]|nr:hypothetical protein [Chloroflexota bacterium]
MRQRDLRPQPAKVTRAAEPGAVSYWVFALGLILGLVLGISFTRVYGPWQRGNAEPWQLRPEDRHHYMMAIALEYAHSSDTAGAIEKLIALRPDGDPLAVLAEAACALGSRGYLGSAGGIHAVRSAVKLYAAQGREGCAELLLPAEVTETPAPVKVAQAPADLRPTLLPTKVPLQDTLLATPTPRYRPDLPERRDFEVLSVRSFCDLKRPALIEVYVVDYLGRGIPGQRIRVRWGEREDIFLSGLKAERGDAYADFQMEEGVDYAIDMAGANGGQGTSLSTGNCYSENRRSLKSYRVTFVER